MPEKSYIVDASEFSRHNIFPGVDIATVAGENMMISLVEFEPNAVVERHSHSNEQMGVMLEGTATFEIGDESFEVGPGQAWRIPGNVPHKVIAHDAPVKAVDIFYPIREDYL